VLAFRYGNQGSAIATRGIVTTLVFSVGGATRVHLHEHDSSVVIDGGPCICGIAGIMSFGSASPPRDALVRFNDALAMPMPALASGERTVRSDRWSGGHSSVRVFRSNHGAPNPRGQSPFDFHDLCQGHKLTFFFERHSSAPSPTASFAGAAKPHAVRTQQHFAPALG
jgi:hypothetical protein